MIYADLVSVPDVSNVWYQQPRQLPIGPALSAFYQSPNCMYDMDFRIYRLTGTNPSNLPIEVGYNENTSTFTYSKCNPLSPAGDDECDISVTPYGKEFTIVIEAFLVEPQSFDTPLYVYNDATQFKVTIEDPCPYDTVSITQSTAIQSFTYFISIG